MAPTWPYYSEKKGLEFFTLLWLGATVLFPSVHHACKPREAWEPGWRRGRWATAISLCSMQGRGTADGDVASLGYLPCAGHATTDVTVSYLTESTK